MTYSALRAAEIELSVDLRACGITVDHDTRTVSWNGFSKTFDPYTPRKRILSVMRKMIRAAKAQPDPNQARLL